MKRLRDGVCSYDPRRERALRVCNDHDTFRGLRIPILRSEPEVLDDLGEEAIVILNLSDAFSEFIARGTYP